MKNSFLRFWTCIGLFFFGLTYSAAVFSKIDRGHLDPDKIIPARLFQQTLDYYDLHEKKIINNRFITIIDYRQHNSKERFYLLDLQSGYVETYLAAHGRNSDPDFDGYATKFSNKPDSKQTSLGFFLTAETYHGSNGYSLRLDGLSTTNSNARSRAIVIHGADYVRPGEKIGRSYGCPALEMGVNQDVIDRIKGGSLIFAAY